MEEKHRELMGRIRNSENEQSQLPPDHLSLNLQIT